MIICATAIDSWTAPPPARLPSRRGGPAGAASTVDSEVGTEPLPALQLGYAKSSMCEYAGRQELDFVSHRLSAEHVSVLPRKGAFRRRVGNADVVRRGAPLHGARQLRPPLRGELRRGRGAADGARQPDTQASFDALKLALSLVLLVCTFYPARRAVLTTDANIAIAAILTEPGEEGHQHPVVYKSRKLTAALLAVVHSLRAFRHFLLGGGAPRPTGYCSDFDPDNQAITWLKTNKPVDNM